MYVMGENWNFLLSEFRRLGGIADNVIQKEGKYGRGIFPFDPTLKARIFTPTKLLVKKDDIFLENNKLRIKNDKEYDQEIRNFFNLYQDNFSWGSGGKETTELFEKGLSLFTPNLKKLIKKYALVDLEERHKGKWDDVIKNQFLNARAVTLKNRSVIAPIWELVNHKVKSFNFVISDEGISTPNYPASSYEITHVYSDMSSLKCFFNYSFFSEETIVFSIPFSVNIQNIGIHISCRGRSLKNDNMKIERYGNQIILDGLPIADVNYPRLPYEYFNEILKKIGNVNIPRDVLMKIFKLNISIRKKILDESNLIDNPISQTLTKLMLYEINLIASHD